jgi:hypothetical protein
MSNATCLPRTWLILSLAFFPTLVFAQQMVSDGNTRVVLWLPDDWRLHTWTLNNPELSLTHVMDTRSGIQIAVRRYSCSMIDVESWKDGTAIDGLVGHEVDEIVPAPDSIAILLPGSVAHITTAERDSLTYKSLTFLHTPAEGCYLLELITAASVFDHSYSTFADLLKGLKFQDGRLGTGRLRVTSADTSSAMFEIHMPDGDLESSPVSTPFELDVEAGEWFGLIRQVVGHQGLVVDFSLDSQGWTMNCTGTTIFVERRDDWGFCTGM